MSRVRVILDCEWDDLEHALATVIAAKPSFDRSPSRPGWGWPFGSEGRGYFVRQTKAGFSATALKPKAPYLLKPIAEDSQAA